MFLLLNTELSKEDDDDYYMTCKRTTDVDR
jgi:hypothetical protein